MKCHYFLIVALSAIPLAPPALADVRDDVVAGISRCAAIADLRTWLDCVYGAAQPARAQLGLPPAPAAQVLLVPPAIPGAPSAHLIVGGAAPTVTAEKHTGLLAKLIGDSDHSLVTKIAMTSYQFNSDGMFTVTLANGQVWAQVGDHSNLAHWREPAARLVVSITLGALKTSNLVVAGERGVYKVRRLR